MNKKEDWITPEEQQKAYSDLVMRAGKEHNGKDILTLLSIIREGDNGRVMKTQHRLDSPSSPYDAADAHTDCEEALDFLRAVERVMGPPPNSNLRAAYKKIQRVQNWVDWEAAG